LHVGPRFFGFTSFLHIKTEKGEKPEEKRREYKKGRKKGAKKEGKKATVNDPIALHSIIHVR
jgi:hypothetical protein